MRFDWLELLKILLPATASLVPTIWTIIKSAKQTRKTLETRMDCFEAKLDNHIAADDERYATSCRVRIQQFNDTLLHGFKHSKESFDQILADITSYNKYCKDNPKFPNSVTTCAAQNIERVYRECMETNSFLI